MRRKWGQTGNAEIVRLTSRRSLRLELSLDDVEWASRDARSEATAGASWKEGISSERLRAAEAELRITYHAVSGPFLSR